MQKTTLKLRLFHKPVDCCCFGRRSKTHRHLKNIKEIIKFPIRCCTRRRVDLIYSNVWWPTLLSNYRRCITELILSQQGFIQIETNYTQSWFHFSGVDQNFTFIRTEVFLTYPSMFSCSCYIDAVTFRFSDDCYYFPEVHTLNISSDNLLYQYATTFKWSQHWLYQDINIEEF